jgi:hypothetical protein
MLCPYGSEPNPSAPPYVWATWIDAKNWLAGLWLPLAWAAAASKAILHDTAVFCATEPLQPVAPDAAAIVAASHDPLAFEQLVQYIEQSAGWWVWHNVCQCIAAPGGTCHQPYADSKTWDTTTSSGDNRINAMRFFTNQAVDLYGVDYWVPSGGQTSTTVWAYDGTASPNSALVSEAFSVAPGLNKLIFSAPVSLTSGHTFSVEFSQSASVQQTYDGSLPSPPSDAYANYGPWYANTIGAGVWAVQGPQSYASAIAPILCVGGGPSDPYAPDPPPPPDVTLPDYPLLECEEGDICILLQQLRAELTQQKTLITLIQRQAVPFAWITGTAHSGLTGTGSFSVQGILGLRVTYTAVPSYWGISSDNPNRYIPAPGSVAFAFAAGGSEDTRWVNVDDQVILQLGDATATQVRYHFKPGITATVTELLREA